MTTLEKQEARLIELGVLIEQREEFMLKGKKEKMNLSREINIAEKMLKNINNLIEEKFAEQRLIIADRQAILDKQISDAKDIVRKIQIDRTGLDKSIDEHNAWQTKEIEDLKVRKEKLERADKEIRERRVINEDKTVELKKRKDMLEEASGDLQRWQNKLSEKSKDINDKTTDLINKERDINTEKTFFENKASDIKKAFDEIEEQHTLNLRRAGALDAKERELAIFKDDFDREIELNKTELVRIKETRGDSVILGKKNQKEKERLDKLAVILHNREHKLAENEKLFKDKIGG